MSGRPGPEPGQAAALTTRRILRIWESARLRFAGDQLLSTTGWSAVGSMLAKGSAMLAMLVAARLLPVDEFGRLALVHATLNQVVMLASAGLGVGATAFVARAENASARRAAFFACLKVGAGLTLLATLGVLAFAVFGANAMYQTDVSSTFVWGFPLVPGILLGGIAAGALAGLGEFRAAAAIAGFAGVLLVVAAAGGSYLVGADGAIAGFAIASLALAAAQAALVVRRTRTSLRVDDSAHIELRRVIKFAMPASLGSIAVVPALFFVNALLIRYEGVGEMGLLAVVLQWQAMVLLPQTAVNPALLSHLARSTGADYWARFRSTLALAAALSGIPALLIASASPLILAMYGPEYVRGWPVLAVLAASGFLAAVVSTIGNVIVTGASMWWAAGLNCLWAVCLVMLAAHWIPEGGALGLGLAHLVSYGAHAIACVTFLLWHRGRTKAGVTEAPVRVEESK